MKTLAMVAMLVIVLGAMMLASGCAVLIATGDGTATFYVAPSIEKAADDAGATTRPTPANPAGP